MSISERKIGKRIAYVRKAARMTQAKLAEKIDISEKYLSRIECGKQVPSIMIVIKICEELQISADELLMLPKNNYSNINEEIQDLLLCFLIQNKNQIIEIIKMIKIQD